MKKSGEASWQSLTVQYTKRTLLFMASDDGGLEREVMLEGGSARFDVHFVLNTFNYDNQTTAAAAVCPSRMDTLFPEREEEDGRLVNREGEGEGMRMPELEDDFFDENVANNAMQAQAVRQIVAGENAPNFYVLFGPPGTGKTVTLVEAIMQVLMFMQNKNKRCGGIGIEQN